MEPESVRIPLGRGTVNILARDSNITVQVRPDRWVLSSEKENILEFFSSVKTQNSYHSFHHSFHNSQTDRNMQ